MAIPGVSVRGDNLGDPEDQLNWAKEVLGGKLELLCLEMSLVTCPGYRQVVFRGMGVIRSLPEGHIEFLMSGDAPERPHPTVLKGLKFGQIPEADDHVMLIAKDDAGREWRSNWMLIDIGLHAMLPRWRLRRRLSSLVTSTPIVKSDRCEIAMWVPVRGRLPFDETVQEQTKVAGRADSMTVRLIRHTHRIGAATVEFSQERDEGWLSVRASSPEVILYDWPGHVSQAMSFARATPTRPIVTCRDWRGGRQFRIGAGPIHWFESCLPPPMVGAGRSCKDFWTLVERFVMVAQSRRGEMDVLFDELARIRAGATAGLPVAALTLSVGIEAIVQTYFKSETAPPAQLAELVEHVKTWKGDEQTRKRGVDAIRGLGSPRASDLLHRWAGDDEQRRGLIKAWKELRNKTAHGARHSSDQSLRDLYDTSAELFHRLVADLVGYEGEILRTSQPGWGLEG